MAQHPYSYTMESDKLKDNGRIRGKAHHSPELLRRLEGVIFSDGEHTQESFTWPADGELNSWEGDVKLL